MRKPLSMLILVVGLVTAGCATTPPSTKTQALVDKARWTVETFRTIQDKPFDYFRDAMKTARGVVVFPEVLKAAFVVGGEGGNGVLLARNAQGVWGQPAFYTMGAGSFGLQIGGQASEIVLVLRNDAAVEAVIEHQGKLGGDLEVTVGTIGAGVEGATTTNLGADILVFAKSAGVYGGGSVEGAVLAKRTDWNEAFYGPGATPRGIVLEGKFANPKSDPLRAALAKF